MVPVHFIRPLRSPRRRLRWAALDGRPNARQLQSTAGLDCRRQPGRHGAGQRRLGRIHVQERTNDQVHTLAFRCGMDGVLLAHETGKGSLSDALVGQMYLINSSMPPPYQESATLAGAITYKQTEPPGLPTAERPCRQYTILNSACGFGPSDPLASEPSK